MGYKEAFCIIIYIVIYIRLLFESLSICVLNVSFFIFHIYTYLNSQIVFSHCRSPPIMRVFWNSYWLEAFFVENFKEDEILGKFITYMDLVLEHVKIDYLKKLRKINYY